MRKPPLLGSKFPRYMGSLASTPSIFSPEINAELVTGFPWGGYTSGRYCRTERDYVILYLVSAEVAGRKFQKIGLTLLENPLHRDREAYKQLLALARVPANNAEAIESVVVSLCRARHDKVNDPTPDLRIPKGWAGATEVVRTSDNILPSFCEAIAICRDYDHEVIDAEMRRVKTLQKEVMYCIPQDENKRVSREVRLIRKLAGVENILRRAEWRDSKCWANTDVMCAVYRHLTGRSLVRQPPTKLNDRELLKMLHQCGVTPEDFLPMEEP